jgi:hypothetical protein
MSTPTVYSSLDQATGFLQAETAINSDNTIKCPTGGQPNPESISKPSDTISAEALANLVRTMGLDAECVKALDNVVSKSESNKTRSGIAKKNFGSFQSEIKTAMSESGCGEKAIELIDSMTTLYNSQCTYNKSANFYSVKSGSSANIVVTFEGITDSLERILENAQNRQAKLSEDKQRFYLYLYDKVEYDPGKMAYITDNIKWPSEGALQSVIYLLEKLAIASVDNIDISLSSSNLVSSAGDSNTADMKQLKIDAETERIKIIDRTIKEETGMVDFSDSITELKAQKIRDSKTNFTNSINDVINNSTIAADTSANIILNLTRPIIIKNLSLKLDSQSGIMASQVSTIATTSAFETVAAMRESEEYKEIVFKKGETIAEQIFLNNKSSLDAAASKAVLKGTNSNGVIIIIAIVIILVIALGVGGYFYAKSKGWIK